MRTISIDFETSNLDYYSKDFKVTDLAVSWRDDSNNLVSLHVQGYVNIYDALRTLSKKDLVVVVHNLTFESGILTSQFPDIKFNIIWDTMRLSQVADAGSKVKLYKNRYKKQGGTPKDGLSLVSCVSRWLPEKDHNHKEFYHKYLRTNCNVKLGQEGANLQLLPTELMRDYNVKDTENTLKLYEEIINQFERDKYQGYILDHQLYRGRVQQLVTAFIAGIKVDRVQTKVCIEEMTVKLVKIREDFFAYHKNEIRKCIAIKIKAYCTDPNLKTDKARGRRWEIIAKGTPFGGRSTICSFNINSSKDLFLLYNHVLGIETPFLTKPNKDGKGGGNPSFKKSHLKAWHESGRILEDRGTTKIVKKQAESLLALSEGDGRYHVELRATGTRSGRLSGGGDATR